MAVLRSISVVAWLLAILLTVSACQKPNVADRSTQNQAAPANALNIPAPNPELGRPAQGLEPGQKLVIPGQSGTTPEIAELPPPSYLPEPPVSIPVLEEDAPPIGLPADYGDGTRIALLLPLTGRDAGLGASMLRAAQLALFDIASDSLILMPYDTGGSPIRARTVAEKAVRDGARLILGPLFSESVRAAAPVARAAGINLIPFSNNREVAQNGTFIMGLLPSDQIRRVISYAGSRGHLRFAALVPNSAYGRLVVQEAQDAAASIGGILSHVEYFAVDGSDLALTVRKIGRYDDRRKALLSRRRFLKNRQDSDSVRELELLKSVETIGDVEFDALLVPVGGARLKQIAALLPFYDIESSRIRLLGVSSWLTPGLGRERPLVGAWFAAPRSDAGLDFARRYRKLYRLAPHDLATLAYDAMALAAVLDRGENGGDFSDIALTSPNGFSGTAGIFRFHENGQVQRGLAVLEVGPKRFREISPSPKTFQALGN